MKIETSKDCLTLHLIFVTQIQTVLFVPTLMISGRHTYCQVKKNKREFIVL